MSGRGRGKKSQPVSDDEFEGSVGDAELPINPVTRRIDDTFEEDVYEEEPDATEKIFHTTIEDVDGDNLEQVDSIEKRHHIDSGGAKQVNNNIGGYGGAGKKFPPPIYVFKNGKITREDRD